MDTVGASCLYFVGSWIKWISVQLIIQLLPVIAFHTTSAISAVLLTEAQVRSYVIKEMGWVAHLEIQLSQSTKACCKQISFQNTVLHRNEFLALNKMIGKNFIWNAIMETKNQGKQIKPVKCSGRKACWFAGLEMFCLDVSFPLKLCLPGWCFVTWPPVVAETLALFVLSSCLLSSLDDFV